MRELLCCVVVTESATFAGFPESVTEAGLKLQAVPAGKPEQAKARGPEKPDIGLAINL